MFYLFVGFLSFCAGFSRIFSGVLGFSSAFWVFVLSRWPNYSRPFWDCLFIFSRLLLGSLFGWGRVQTVNDKMTWFCFSGGFLSLWPY